MRWLIGTLTIVTGTMLGCGTPKPIMYYQLQLPVVPTPATYTYPIQMVVGRISGSDLLETAPLLYKTKRNEVGQYQYHRWSDSPVQKVQEKLIRMLRVSGEYQSVSGMGNSSGGELMLRGRLYD